MAANLLEYFKRDRFAELIGAELIEAGKGYARARLTVRPDHLNAHDVLHGGLLFALADFTFAAIAAAANDTVALAVQAGINFMHAVRGGVLTAEARELSRGRKIGNYQVDIRDETGRVIAVFTGVVYDKGEPLTA